MLGVWQALLRERVFPLTDLSENGKQELTFRKRLLSQPGMAVLMIVWKPRGFIGTREPTVALGKRKAIDATLVREGHG